MVILQVGFFLSTEDTSCPEASLVGFKTLSQILKRDHEVLANIFSLEESGISSQKAAMELFDVALVHMG